MRTKAVLLVWLLIIASFYNGKELLGGDLVSTRALPLNKDAFPDGFVRNVGQTDPELLFYYRVSSIETVFMTQTGVIWQWQDESSDVTEFIKMRCHRGNENAKIVGANQIGASSNYFLGANPANWYTSVQHYQLIKYVEIYPEIDLIFHQKENELEFDFEIRPGAEPGLIQLHFGNVRSQLDRSGDLIVSSATHQIRLKKPVAYQFVDGKKKLVPSWFEQRSANIKFGLGDYDRNKTLIIDPVVSYSTYQGASLDDRANAVAVDLEGNVYITGSTTSRGFPTRRPFQSKRKGKQDAFVSKFSPSGSLIYSRFLGGKGNLDSGFGIAVDSEGQVIVVGQTSSSNFPVKSAIQPKLNGEVNAFITKLSANGKRLVFSTYFGGSGGDVINAIALDLTGNIYITGGADSPDFPVTRSLQPSIGGLADAFVAKVSSDGSTIIYSTFLGGRDDDIATGLTVDDSGQVYVTGQTLSRNFPLRRPLQSKVKGINDGFISKLNSSGSRLVFSTLIGGDGDPLIGGQDRPESIAVDSSHNIWITGYTTSESFPLVHPLQDSIKGNFDAFVIKLNRRGSKILFSTYLGGSISDNASSISLDSSGNVYVAGRTNSPDFPVFESLQQFNKFGDDAFVTGISSSGSGFIFSTFLGGTNQETATAIKVFGEFITVCGRTSSYDFPLVNPSQSTKKGNSFSHDAFVTKIKLTP